MATTGKEFIEFWSWASNKGKMNKNTAQSLATASKQVMSVEDDWESIDVSTIDIDDLMLRFRNIRKKDFTTHSLQVYERKFRQALKLFLEFSHDPTNWKYKTQTATASKSKPIRQRINLAPNLKSVSSESQSSEAIPLVDYPYPLRENCIVRMKLPVDLRTSDVERLITFLRTLVINFE